MHDWVKNTGCLFDDSWVPQRLEEGTQQFPTGAQLMRILGDSNSIYISLVAAAGSFLNI